MIHDIVLKQAEVAAKIFRSAGYRLDYSIASLEIVDKRIEDFRQEGETSHSMAVTMTCLGMYLGEVIRRRLGRGEWIEQGSCLGLKIGSITAYPIGRCMRRLDDGPTASVKPFAEATMRIANMSVEDFRATLPSGDNWRLREVVREA